MAFSRLTFRLSSGLIAKEVSLKTVIRLMATAVATMLVCALIHPSSPASAQTPSLQGTFTLDSAASQDIKAAVDKVADQMSFLTRSIARSRLMATNPPVSRIAISFSGKNVTIQAADSAAITTRTDGTPIDWVGEDGENVKVSTVWAGATLKRSLVNPNGMRVNTYAVDPTGNTLTLDVLITASQLPQPLAYKLVFRRSK